MKSCRKSKSKMDRETGPFLMPGRRRSGTAICENYLVLIGDFIIGWDFQITVNDTVIRTAGAARLEEICTAVFQYKEYIFFWSSSSEPVQDDLYPDSISGHNQ